MKFDDPESSDNNIPLKASDKKIVKSNSKDNLLTSPLIENEVKRVYSIKYFLILIPKS
jgi:hypothetical protein